MGTNYYLMSRNKELMQNNFAINNKWGVYGEEYRIVDKEPVKWVYKTDMLFGEKTDIAYCKVQWKGGGAIYSV